MSDIDENRQGRSEGGRVRIDLLVGLNSDLSGVGYREG
jgi:hypothetical protein